ncbi:ATP-binding cassette domain-containing protein [Microbacterium terricola]|uniref:Daunorubicin resistance protein DrrA family ABC transporter ATP-binding protein n=1 Tax=Microbacterium terricola TaxID=344163 RepID=A0ABM8E1Q1_9MICO|nr:ATP-binding cassette domain-containing protein [Microbacterium terricola]UYK40581.1 ATP-binding cassette domain-containing protein [Microbacterium terricola]BDV31690.1 daunorubicin resistance protein DrrA family ABC transporter ATP-binding protein [Microbacterium terricola]
MHAIETRGLRKAYGGQSVLDGLDLTVAAGEVFALLGPNGAGKTTTIGILTTLVRPDGGTATVGGVDVVADPRGVAQRISLTGQSAAVDEVLTGTENLVMLGRLSGLTPRRARDRADELLDRFDLADAAARRVGTYSGGMRRRLDLALSFVVTPQVLFLDEPTTGLDTRSRRELWDVIRELASEGTTVFLTTQYLEEADRLADRIAVLDGGRLVAGGTPAELKARAGADVVELRDADGMLLHEAHTDGTAADIRRALDAFGDDAGVISIRRPTLDDVFLALTGGATALDSRRSA